MATREPSQHPAAAQAEERGSALVLLPIAATLGYYSLPVWLREQTPVQLGPQIIAYWACALWTAHNRRFVSRFGIEKHKLGRGLRWGMLVGLVLGCVNSLVILKLFPALGYDIRFLRQTPHAQLPVFVMVPWFIFGIALFVEFNFRGFLLGRLLALGEALWGLYRLPAAAGAIGVSAIVFAFDPFLMATFKHLHWIALWDGVIWASLWVRTRNLYTTIAAHTVEVIVMYVTVRAALSH